MHSVHPLSRQRHRRQDFCLGMHLQCLPCLAKSLLRMDRFQCHHGRCSLPWLAHLPARRSPSHHRCSLQCLAHRLARRHPSQHRLLRLGHLLLQASHVEQELCRPAACHLDARRPAARSPAACHPAARSPAACRPAARRPAACRPAACRPALPAVAKRASPKPLPLELQSTPLPMTSCGVARSCCDRRLCCSSRVKR